MEKKHLFTHAEAAQILRGKGFSEERIQDLLHDLPDPIDTERDGDALVQRGISYAQLMDRMGASP